MMTQRGTGMEAAFGKRYAANYADTVIGVL